MRSGLLLAGVLLVGANLRASITSVGPVLEAIRGGLAFGGATASILISAPLVAFAVVSPVAPALARRIGIERCLGLSLLLLMLAIIGRSTPLPGAIWTGTALLGAAIAVLNVLLPALIKRTYPKRIGTMTGLYSATASTFAAIAAGLAVPIADATPAGWRLSLGIWAGLALVGFVLFLPQLRFSSAGVQTSNRSAGTTALPLRTGGVWSSALAWHVTLFLGLQSAVYFTVITWWSTIESKYGISDAVAGWHQFAFQIIAIAGNLGAAALIQRLRNQELLTFGSAALACVGVLGQLVAPALALLWLALLGISAGGSFVIGISLFGLRTRNHQQAAVLSGMAQSVGYLIAALGPLLFGVLHDVTGTFRLPLTALFGVTMAELLFGTLASRAVFIDRARLRPERCLHKRL